MNRRSIVSALLALLFILTLFTGCGSRESKPADSVPVSSGDVSSGDVSSADVSASDWRALLTGADEIAIADVIVSSTDSFNARDLNAYMSTIEPGTEIYESTREQTAWMFSEYHLRTEIEELTVDGISGDTAKVTVTQSTRRVNSEGKAFTPRRTVLEHTMVRINGRWYISSTLVRSLTEIIDPWRNFINFVSDPSAFIPSGSDIPAAEASSTDA